MGNERAQDLLLLDRAVARGHSALARWRSRLAEDPETHADEDPLQEVRAVAGKSTWDALRELAPVATDALLRDALLPWVGVLTLARIDRPGEVACARAEANAVGRFDGEPARMVTWRQAWRGVAGAKTVEEAGLWLDAAAAAGEGLADAARASAETRVEVTRRLGLAHPWGLFGLADAGALRTAAQRLLDATEDVALAARKEATRDGAGAAAVIHSVVGREAGEGWPPRLGARWLEDLYGSSLAGLRVELPSLPSALGAASFARALYVLGFAVGVGAAPAAISFALAREPGARAQHRLGFVFAGLAADAEWQVRALGLGRRVALRQARALARTALLDVRLHAARLLLGDERALAPRDLFEELGPRLFGSLLDIRFRGAWPRARRDEPARFVALVDSLSMTDTLRERFDVDWFRNPHAWVHLRTTAAAPLRDAVDPRALHAGVEALARAFERAFG